MRRQSIALVASAIWGVALAATGAGFALGLPVLGYCGLAAGAPVALLVSVVLGRRADRREARKLQSLGQAVGLDAQEAAGLDGLARSLFGRLDRGRAFKAAVQELGRPVMLVDGRGDILSFSRGLKAIYPDAAEGTAAGPLFAGETGDLLASHGMVLLGGRRYRAERHELPGDRTLIELEPAGHLIPEDDFEAFVQALGNGRTGFRFDAWGAQHTPSLRSLGEAMGALDRGFKALNQLFRGEAVDPALVAGAGGFAGQVRLYLEAHDQILAERDMALEARAGLQSRLDAILSAIERYRDSVSALAELADRSRAGLQAANVSMGVSRDRTFGLQQLEKEALALAADAALAAERNLRAVSGLHDNAAAMEKAVATLEDASHRTSVVALNAAVEASRVGEKAATFALLAGEVRNLAQVSQRAVREIRMLVTASRASIGTSSGETGLLQKSIKDLGIRLHNISRDTDIISGTLAEGSGTMARLDSHFGAVGTEAAKAMLIPRASDSSAA